VSEDPETTRRAALLRAAAVVAFLIFLAFVAFGLVAGSGR
jgi:hypothetical protein